MTEPRVRPTVPYVLPLAVQVYWLPDWRGVDERNGRTYTGGHGAGGHLHIVLDDDNVEDGHVQYCLESAERDGCEHCMLVAWLLLQMTETQRLKVAADVHGALRDIEALEFAEEAYCPCAYHMRERRKATETT